MASLNIASCSHRSGADINLVEFERVRLHAPEVMHTSRPAASPARGGGKATRLRSSPAPGSSSAASAAALGSAASCAAGDGEDPAAVGLAAPVAG
jgi:hypothetical protein